MANQKDINEHFEVFKKRMAELQKMQKQAITAFAKRVSENKMEAIHKKLKNS